MGLWISEAQTQKLVFVYSLRYYKNNPCVQQRSSNHPQSLLMRVNTLTIVSNQSLHRAECIGKVRIAELENVFLRTHVAHLQQSVAEMGAHLVLQQIRAQLQEDEIQQLRMRLQQPIGKRCRDVNAMPIEKLNSRFNLHA